VPGDEIVVRQHAEPGDPLASLHRLPRQAVDVVVVDAPAVRQRRADRVRFPVSLPGGESLGWLYCRDECSIPTLGLSLGRPRCPALSLFDGVGAGTLVVAKGEFRRLLGMTPDERGAP
jgi:hypothetical protein